MRKPTPRATVGLAALLCLAAVFVAPFVGSEPVAPLRAWSDLLTLPRAAWSPDAAILGLRLPRILLALLSGAGLAVAGAVMQSLLRNPLASPYTLGAATAASLGAFAGVVLGAGAVARPGPALVLAVLDVVLVLAVARRSRRPDGLVLAGVTLNFAFGAGVLLLRHLARPTDLAAMERWLLGSLEAVDAGPSLALLPWLAVGFTLLARRVGDLDQLAFHPALAEARGVAADAVRREGLLAAGLLTAAVVAQAGPIGFVGLLVPHVVRPGTGLRHAWLLPGCALAGGGFLVLADAVARSLDWFGRTSDLPVGVVTALLGGPAFLALLLRRSS